MAAMFSEEEWDILEEAQRSLFRNVMHEIQNVLIRLGLGLDILLRINYLGQGKEVENCDQRVIKAEPDFLPRVHQEEDGDFPDTFPAEGRLLCTPGRELDPVRVKKEAAVETSRCLVSLSLPHVSVPDCVTNDGSSCRRFGPLASQGPAPNHTRALREDRRSFSLKKKNAILTIT
ncbi:hypothetical protein GDO81_021629 [Engystomops pustulosus]|uniref:KRAB domain-containing protein n=1 Tax=Engystomops pustulosus TaxID=76066 RepID=A0AAV6ZC12_ENGPU|nr:hypothetical protein GDO81_021629 [Engystomops pustulosus]